MLRDTVDSINSRDRWLLAQLSKPARTLPAPFYWSDGVASFSLFLPHLFGARGLRCQVVLRPTTLNNALAIGLLDYLHTCFRLDRFAVADAFVLLPLNNLSNFTPKNFGAAQSVDISPLRSAVNTPILESDLVCPICGFAKRETMPTNACQFFYECTSCHALLRPKPGDCCVFCSYGSVKCPSMQPNNRIG